MVPIFDRRKLLIDIDHFSPVTYTKIRTWRRFHPEIGTLAFNFPYDVPIIQALWTCRNETLNELDFYEFRRQ